MPYQHRKSGFENPKPTHWETDNLKSKTITKKILKMEKRKPNSMNDSSNINLLESQIASSPIQRVTPSKWNLNISVFPSKWNLHILLFSSNAPCYYGAFLDIGNIPMASSIAQIKN